MSRSRSFRLFLFSLFLPLAVLGQNTRSAVSVTGVDSASCTVPDPCRTFGTALSKTNSGGEILVLSSGGYGPFTINKAVSVITPEGIYAGLAASAGDAITINAGPSDTIVLRGLNINSFGALFGIRFVAGAALHATNLVIRNFNVSGIHFVAPSFLIVNQSVLIGNGSGILVDSATATARASLEGISFERNVLYGLEVRDHASVAIKNSRAVGGDNGLVAGPDLSGVTSELDVENCLVTGTLTGIKSGGGSGTAKIRVSNSTIVGNDFGVVHNAPSTNESRGNNTLAGNVTDGTFSGTFLPK